MSHPVRFAPDLQPLLVDIDQVTPHPRNPNATNIDQLAEAIVLSGFHTAVVAQKSTRYLLDGNQRQAALHALGATQIPVVFLDVDDATATRILLGSNRIARLGLDDPALICELAAELASGPLGLAGTGWDTDQVDALASYLDDPLDLDGLDLENRAPAPQKLRTITCPSCGHHFGGTAAGKVTPAGQVYQ